VLKTNNGLNRIKETLITGKPQGRAQYFTTTRHGGVSQGPWSSWNLGAHCGDNMQAVEKNRKRLQSLLPAPAQWLNQIHGNTVVELKRLKNGEKPMVYTADAAFTRDTNCVLAILTADCLPVVIGDTQNRILGVAHVGWRGLASGVLDNLALALARYCIADEWFAWIGPAISATHFEVGLDVYQALARSMPEIKHFFQPLQENKWVVNLSGIAKARIKQSFQAKVHVELSQQCSFTDQLNFYSYRRDGITGRMATVAWLKEGA